jgi:hypothetical protein
MPHSLPRCCVKRVEKLNDELVLSLLVDNDPNQFEIRSAGQKQSNGSYFKYESPQ